MTKALDQKRRAEAAWVAALALLSGVGATLAYGVDQGRRAPPQSPGLAAPALAARPEAAEVILVTTKDASYRLVREGDAWVMRDRGGYPVRQEAVTATLRSLAALGYARPMTRDPMKHARLGLDDPRAGGDGTLLQVQDAQGALLADVVVGRAESKLYVRAATADQTWTAAGDMPPLKDASAWLDLRPFQIPAGRVARLDVLRAEATYALFKATPEDPGFQISRPFAFRPAIDPKQFDLVATALGQLEPADVAGAPTIAGAPSARAVLQTFDGLVISAEVFERPERTWLKVSARATFAERAAEAAAINRQAGPWAFAFAPEAAAVFAPPVRALVVMPAAEAETAPLVDPAAP